MFAISPFTKPKKANKQDLLRENKHFSCLAYTQAELDITLTAYQISASLLNHITSGLRLKICKTRHTSFIGF